MSWSPRSQVLLTLAATACGVPAARTPTPVEGVWEIREVASRDGSGTVNRDLLPSLFIFAQRHYSMVQMRGAELKTAFVQRWSPTDAEKIERYNAILVNSGTYEMTDSTLTTHPIVARIPDLMGGHVLYEYHVVGDTLWLTSVDEYSYDGGQAPWAAAGRGSIRTLVRIDR